MFYIDKLNSYKIGLNEIIYFNVFMVSVPLFMQIGIYLYIKNRRQKEGYFIKRMGYLLITYLFWTIASSMILNKEGFNILYFKNIKYIITGGNSHIYFLFLLLILSLITEIVIKIKSIMRTKVFFVLQFIVLIGTILMLVFRQNLARFLFDKNKQDLVMAYYSVVNFLAYIPIAFIVDILEEKQYISYLKKYVVAGIGLLLIVIITEWKFLPSSYNFEICSNLIPTYGRVSIVLSVILVLLWAISKKQEQIKLLVCAQA